MKSVELSFDNIKLGLNYLDSDIVIDEVSYENKVKEFMKELNELESKYNFTISHFAYTDSDGFEESQLLLEDNELNITIAEINMD